MSARTNLVFVLLAVFVFLSATSTADAVNGALQVENGQRILRLWGNHFEMGYAHGFLMAGEIVRLVDEYFIGVQWQPWTYTHTIRPTVEEFFVLPPEYQEELEAMLKGIVDSGVSTYLESVERDLDLLDLHTANCYLDFLHWLCSSVSAWGEMTEDDPLLAGATAIVRNFEYPLGPDALLAVYSLLIAFDPSSPDEKQWVSVTWPGIIGCVSCMNEDGIGHTMNSGDNILPADPEPQSVTSLWLTIRDAIENIDENGDGRESVDDVIYAIDRDQRLGGTLAHIFSPFEIGQKQDPVVLVESDFYNYVIRRGTNNLDCQRYIYSEHCLAVMNQSRLLHGCRTADGRYAKMADSLNAGLHVDTEKLWRMERVISYPTTVQAMLFRPNLRDLLVAFGDSVDTNAFDCPRVHWTWDALFPPR
ncbi:MAG: hypothetical protein KAW17_12400 [Candidatus Eisenbacteria sp.]|nr:hypothetical protein [Candidatus Eisenbacteria bacterium]